MISSPEGASHRYALNCPFPGSRRPQSVALAAHPSDEIDVCISANVVHAGVKGAGLVARPEYPTRQCLACAAGT